MTLSCKPVGLTLQIDEEDDIFIPQNQLKQKRQSIRQPIELDDSVYSAFRDNESNQSSVISMSEIMIAEVPQIELDSVNVHIPMTDEDR